EDGSDINNSPLYPTNYWEAIGGSSQSFSDYTLPSDAAKMFDKMEMRFYASVGFNHCYWSGLSYIGTEGNQTKQTVTYYA
ncbi:RagB/SusD family nutrient uptake outer membrane protein, partial [Klebsiella oxytoca]